MGWAWGLLVFCLNGTHGLLLPMLILPMVSAEAHAADMREGAVLVRTSTSTIPLLADSAPSIWVFNVGGVLGCFCCSLWVNTELCLHKRRTTSSPPETQLTLLLPINGIKIQHSRPCKRLREATHLDEVVNIVQYAMHGHMIFSDHSP